jgi:hypothetical protein
VLFECEYHIPVLLIVFPDTWMHFWVNFFIMVFGVPQTPAFQKQLKIFSWLIALHYAVSKGMTSNTDTWSSLWWSWFFAE